MNTQKNETVNFTELVKLNNNTLPTNVQDKLIVKLNETFQDSEQRWYAANLYLYLNYHPTDDYPIDLDNVYSMIGFANKENAKRTLVNNFKVGHDYKIHVGEEVNPARPKGRTDGLLHNSEWKGKQTVLLNTDTFKDLCMISRTEKGKEIRKYYLKLESISNSLVKDIIDDLNNKLIQNSKETAVKIKMDRHKLLIDKFRYKKCVYIAEVTRDNMLIKIGSSKNIAERINGLNITYGTCIFLDIFEHNDYQVVEHNILQNVKENMCRDSINGHTSKEVVRLSSEFNYSQLYKIVRTCLDTTNFLSPGELLRKSELDVEEKRLDTINNLIKQGSSIDDIKSIMNFKIQKEQISELTSELSQEDSEIEMDIQHSTIEVSVKGRKPKGKKIQKIDPYNLENVLKTYDSMIYLLRSIECTGYNKSGIQDAIKKSMIYRGYRWNYEGVSPGPTVISNQPITEPILKLNESKDIILESYPTKDKAAASIGIGKLKMREIVRTGAKYNTFYFIEFSKCDKDIVKKYNKPIFGNNSVHAKKIKQTNPITNQSILFNSLNEIYIKFGISSKTLQYSIENKTTCNGSLWEFV
jgi:hypothetical protein